MADDQNKKPNTGIVFTDTATADLYEKQQNQKTETKEEPSILAKILSELKTFESLDKAEKERTTKVKMAFDVDPQKQSVAGGSNGMFRDKGGLLPNSVIQRIVGPGGDDLVCQILTARSNHISLMGRPRDNRFDIGFDLNPKDESKLPEDPTKMEELMREVEEVKETIWKCGRGKVRGESEQPNFSQFLQHFVRDGVSVGYAGTEIIREREEAGSPFYAFRPVDSSTIYKTTEFYVQDDSFRKQALIQIEKLKFVNFDKSKFLGGDYTHVQVINGVQTQMFTSEELLVHNFYPSNSVDYNGYPLTPLDQAIHAVTTHINITHHNKLYFEHGRAARGMLVVKARGIDEGTLQAMRLQFQQTINSVKNSHKMPVFGIGPEDNITWQPIDNSQRDMEFSYLSDANARVILGAWQMSPDELPGYAHLCLHPDTSIWTDKGFMTIGELLGSETSISGFKVWTGTEYVNAKAFTTGTRKLSKTITSNGVTLNTSPDHLFRTVNEAGNLAWTRQSNLKIGDTVLVNRKPIPGSAINIPSYKGKALTPEMMEILGWLTGDGSIVVRKKGLKKHSKELEFYYHHDKEVWIRERHLKILRDFGLSPKSTDKQISQTAIDRQKRKFGFKTVSSVKTLINLYNTEFVGWLLSLGFSPSSQGKTIPNFIHGLPIEYRSAFLKGFFSADGSIDSLNTPTISITSSIVREQTKRLLLNMGIRTRGCEGTSKTTYIKKEDGSGDYDKKYIKQASRLIVKDKVEFFEKIGFLQDHKQPKLSATLMSKGRWDKVTRSVAISFADKLLSLNSLIGSERDEIRQVFKDSKYPYQVRSKFNKYIDKYRVELPRWVDDYYQEPIASLESSEESVEMVDIEVFNNEHAFIAEGVVVHNSKGSNSQALSESSNEYKLTAQRDVGLRPLMLNVQDFVNSNLLPLISKNVAKYFSFVFAGLDKDSPEKEATRLQQDAQTHMTYNDILDAVDKERLSKTLGANLPLNQQFWATVSPYLTVGQIMEGFMGVKNASKDPRYMYIRDPLWFQWQQMLQQEVQLKLQSMMANQQQQQAIEMQGQQQGQPQDQNAQPENLQRSEMAISDLEAIKKKWLN